MDKMKHEGLLFLLSGEQGTRAEYACGDAEPVFCDRITCIDGGVDGSKALSCADRQLYAFNAPGNIYARRGTLSFFWRSRYPVGPTPFPIFRVGFSDHSSWDAVWLRIDYNGKGFDAFVTDVNLARLRVSTELQPFPAPEQWIHLALSWDEASGIRFYINGAPAASVAQPAVLDSGLSMFGPHSRIISNYSVQSSYNFTRGGDIDEVRIYDHMLAPEDVASLAALMDGPFPAVPASSDNAALQAFLRTQGMDRNAPQAPVLPYEWTWVHRLAIHDAYDQKRWWWKACDGIRETTWPGVYNRSRLPGRNDYFQLPDWDCYSTSGKAITFHLPQESWNHVEMFGSAWGSLSYEQEGKEPDTLVARPQNVQRSSWRWDQPHTGGRLRFENVEMEEPIGEFSVFNVQPWEATPSVYHEKFIFNPADMRDAGSSSPASSNGVSAVENFIAGRFMPGYRSLLVGSQEKSNGEALSSSGEGRHLLHCILPYTRNFLTHGLDGLVLSLPAASQTFQLSIRIKDPIWVERDVFDFTCTVEAGRTPTVFCDFRDIVPPEGKTVYVVLTSDVPVFTDTFISSLYMTLRAGDLEKARREYADDHFIMVRDVYGHLLEEKPKDDRFAMYSRFLADVSEVLRVDPGHRLAQEYAYDMVRECGADIPWAVRPPVDQTPVPSGVPPWAYRQLEYMGFVRRFLQWWIDERQTENGELGGGLSDDGDLTAFWPGPAMAGILPAKVRDSLRKELDAFYDQGMFTNGLCTIQTDDLHVFEEGIQALGQALVLEDDDPDVFERGMETARAMLDITDYDDHGLRRFVSAYYSGSVIAHEDPWLWITDSAYVITHPLVMIARYTGLQKARELVLELADGLFAHYRDGVMYGRVHFPDGADERGTQDKRWWFLMLAAYRMSGDRKYLDIIPQEWQGIIEEETPIDKTAVSRVYEKLIEDISLREYINCEGSIWVDRCVMDINRIQNDRLGGVAHNRFCLYPRHHYTWKFASDDDAFSVAVLSPVATERKLVIVAHNVSQAPLEASIILADVSAGHWKIVSGYDDADTDTPRIDREERRQYCSRGTSLSFTFAPHATRVVELELEDADISWTSRPDLAISLQGTKREHNGLRVKVTNMGGGATVPVDAVLYDAGGSEYCRRTIPAMEAPADLSVRSRDVVFLCPREGSLEGWRVVVDPEGRMEELSRRNNIVELDGSF